MSFDPDKYLAENDFGEKLKQNGGFDPDSYLAENSPKSSAAEAFTGQGSDALLLGYAPQAVAGLTKAAVGVHNLFSDNEIIQPDYVKLRDETRQEMNRAKEDHPYASGAGTAAGILASAPLLAAKGAQGASTLARMGNAAKTGAIVGGLSNPGDTEGEISPLQIGDRATNAAIGFGVGGAAQGLVEGLPYVTKGARSASGYFNELSNEKAAKTLGHLSKFEKAADKGTAQEIGQLIRDEKLLSPISTPERLLPKVEKLKKLAGQDIGDIIGKADKGVSIDFEKMAIELLTDPDVERLSRTPGMEGSFNKVASMLETLAKNKKLGLKEAQELRQGVDQGINFSRRGDSPVPEGFAKKIRTGIRDTMNNVVNASDELNGMPSGDRLKAANKKYSLLSEAEDIADQQVARNAKNRSFGLTDTIAAGAGFGSGGPTGAAALGLLNKGIRTFGNANASLAAGGASKLLNQIPRFAEMAKGNPGAFNALAQRMTSRLGGEGSLEAIPGLSPKLLEQFSQNPELIDSLSNDKLKEQIRNELEKKRNPAQSRPIDEKQAQDMFIQGN